MDAWDGPFGGVIGRYHFESQPWWPPEQRAPDGAPNVLIVEVARSQAALLTQLVTAPGHPFVAKYVLRPQSEWGKMAPDGSSYTPNYEPSKGPAVPTPGDTTTSPSDIESLFGH